MSTFETKEQVSAGGVVYRRRAGRVEVALISVGEAARWQLPKGLVGRGESPAEAALREVREETGAGCRLLRELPDDHYTDRKGRPKRVRWWLMELVALDVHQPDDEVDEVRWVQLGDAVALLSYAHDRGLVAGVADA